MRLHGFLLRSQGVCSRRARGRGALGRDRGRFSWRGCQGLPILKRRRRRSIGGGTRGRRRQQVGRSGGRPDRRQRGRGGAHTASGGRYRALSRRVGERRCHWRQARRRSIHERIRICGCGVAEQLKQNLNKTRACQQAVDVVDSGIFVGRVVRRLYCTSDVIRSI